MKKTKFTESQIIGILKEQEAGKKVAEICRTHGISQPTFYGWKSKYSGLEVNQVKRLKELESELSQYKKIVAEQTLHITVLKDVIEKKAIGPAEKRELITYAHEEHKISIRQACKLFDTHCSIYYYKANPRNDEPIREAFSQLAVRHNRWGFWMMYRRLRNLNYTDNHKRMYRIYTAMKLNLRRKHKMRLPARILEPLAQPIAPNLTWSMDFMHDGLIGGKPSVVNIIDDFNRESLVITLDTSLTSHRIIRELNRLIEWRGKPTKLRVDNGPEFVSAAMELWAEKNKIQLKFIQKGKPHQNGYIERFNRTYREEILDNYAFDSLAQARMMTQAWIWVYNNERPHSSLGYMTPRGFLLKYGKCPDTQDPGFAFPTFQQDEENKWENMFVTATS